MKKSILFSLMVIGAVAALITAATTATFSDQVTSAGNTFTAGTLFQSVDLNCGLTPDNQARTSGAGGVGGGSPCALGSAGFSTPGNMKPTDSSTHTFNIRNDGTLPGTLTISQNPAATVTGSTPGTCLVSDWTITPLPAPATLNAGGTTSYAVTVTLNAGAGNGCQGKTLNLNYQFDLVQL